MEKKGFKLYGSKVYGVEVSDYGLKTWIFGLSSIISRGVAYERLL